jgi:hypothetical protein
LVHSSFALLLLLLLLVAYLLLLPLLHGPRSPGRLPQPPVGQHALRPCCQPLLLPLLLLVTASFPKLLPTFPCRPKASRRADISIDVMQVTSAPPPIQARVK